MSRSVWKVPYIPGLIEFHGYNWRYRVFYSSFRNITIPDTYIDRNMRVYNGKHFISFIVKSAMVGQKFGEFSLTKVLGSAIHSSMQLKSRRKKKNKKSK